MLAILSATLIAQAAACAVDVEQREPGLLMFRSSCGPKHSELHAAMRGALAGRSGEVRVGLGRIVTWPWLSAALARQASSSRIWDPEHGTARGSSDNAYVAAALRGMPEFTVLFDEWTLAGLAVEKVLRRRAGELPLAAGMPLSPDALLPYDAIVWVTLKKAK